MTHIINEISILEQELIGINASIDRLEISSNVSISDLNKLKDRKTACLLKLAALRKQEWENKYDSVYIDYDDRN